MISLLFQLFTVCSMCSQRSELANPVQLLMYFCWNSVSDCRHTCELLVFIIWLVLRLIFYHACQLNIIACMPGCG